MILFEQDWKKYPGAIPDYQTQNKTFLTYCATLRAMGIRNCLFPLALHDQTLVGIDPHSPDLTKDQMIRILLEIEINPWYFLREVARIPVDGVDGGIKVEANRGIIAQWWCIRNNWDIFMEQPRQTGKSVGVDLDSVYLTMFRKRGGRMLSLTKDRGLIAKNVTKLKLIRDHLPPYLWVPTNKDKDVEYMFNYAHHDNQINFICAQADSFKAKNASRGHTVTRFHCDEVPFVKYVDEMIPSISSSMDDAIMRAAQHGEDYGRIYTTTPGDLSMPWGKYAYNLYINSYPFDEQLFDRKDKHEIDKLARETTGLPITRLSLTFNHRQLGISDEEFYRRIRSVDSSDEDINKDYFLIWGKGGVESLVSGDILTAMDESVRQPNHVVMTETGYVEKWYIDEAQKKAIMSNGHYILGVDTSSQIGRDATACVLISPYDLNVIMTMSIRNANIINAANWLCQFLITYENVTLIIENKSSAQTFIDTILLKMRVLGINPLKRLWSHVIDNEFLKPKYYMQLRSGRPLSYDIIQDECRKYIGFTTTGKTRDLLYSKVLRSATGHSRNVMHDGELVNQLAMLRTDENGRVDHQSGEHDDKCIAWLLCHWMIMYGKHLDYYGIESHRIMLGMKEDGTKMSDQDIHLMELIEECQEDADRLIKLISTCQHAGMKQKYQHDLDRANEFLKEHGIEPKVIDAVIQESKVNRRTKRGNSYY